MSHTDFDILVIGVGPDRYVAAVTAAELGQPAGVVAT